MNAPNDPRELNPVRLLDAQATPGALRDALQVLRQRGPSPEAAARIQQSLGKPARPTARGGSVRYGLALIALIGGASWLAWPEHAAVEPPRSASPSEAPVLPLPASARAPVAHAPAAKRALMRATDVDTGAVEPAALAASAHEPESEQGPVAAVKRSPKPALAIKPARPAPTLEELAERAVQQPAAPLATRASEAAALPATTPPNEDAERVFADPQDEAGLLYRAKRLSRTDPNAALRLLVLHEASFPDGTFAQERDMLEIQIHERLGHAGTAKRLAALFKQRYPGSVYRVGP